MDGSSKKKKNKVPPPFADGFDRRPRIETLPEGIVTLRVVTEGALRARCRRAAADPDENGNAVIAPGVYAIKIGTHWRIKYV
jgi:hypothetical protein